jgi:hypothetical protein
LNCPQQPLWQSVHSKCSIQTVRGLPAECRIEFVRNSEGGMVITIDGELRAIRMGIPNVKEYFE